MRIQHNIMAMSAYRNYNTNTSALSKNLEKLSSGYKINRAGDDAAGLAISEKMRAQITGLNAAQKNVKDGISLVKTAEGAMQEIQDMLNRMDYLATQSANGTYQDEVDRENLNKEMEALKTEINRIADSANFNGIKLLDGSLDPSAEVGGSAAVEAVESGLETATVGSVLGTNTIKHTEGSGNGEATTFKIDLADFQFAANDGESMTIKVGENTFKLTADNTATGPLTGEDIVNAITGNGTPPTGVTVTLDPGDGTFAAYTAGDDVTFNGQTVEVSADGNKLVFTQADAPTTAAEEVDGKMDVVISGPGVNTNASIGGTATTANIATNKGTMDFAASNDAILAAVKKLGINADGDITIEQNADPTKYDLKVGTTVIGTASVDNANGWTGNYVAANGTATLAFEDADGNALGTATIKAGAANVTTPELAPALDTGLEFKAPATGNGYTTGGDWNVQTIEVENGTAEVRGRLASTVVKLKDDQIVNGAQLKIGTQTITLSDAEADKATPVSTSKIYIGDLKKDDGTIDMDLFTERLSQATADNTIWTVSAKASKDGITLMEATNADGTSAGNAAAKTLLKDKDLTTEEGIKATLGYVSAAKAAVAGTAGKGLNLQIGDTSDPFNQMKIEVGDMHVEAMKYTDDEGNTASIRNIDILTSENAQKAVDVIKNAINYVSGVRGDLGAYQNRLEHTSNNLSVMAENIQDAESSIRDTDIAEEMMAYTKNNILVQSAQAMLAQANQVPQGVLQLLG